MSLLLAITFLTIIPLRRGAQVEQPALGRAMFWFPLVGVLIGCATAGMLFGATRILPGILPPVVAVVFLAGLTGALHLDGLADTFDGLFGGRDREARLRIMRDKAIGAYGLAAVVCLLLLKVGAVTALADRTWLSGLPGPWRAQWLLDWFGRTHFRQVAVVALAPVWGRWMMTLAAGIGPYARRNGGTGAIFVSRMTVYHSGLLVVIPVGLTAYVLGWPGVLAGALTVLVAILLLAWWRGKVGGVTGDTMGALGELTEAVFLLMALIVLPVGKAGPPY